MPKISAGLLLYRRREGGLEVFLVHPGGPFWAGKDRHAWSIPKGECDPAEDPRAAARREFFEETGMRPQGPLIPLTPRRQAGGKLVHAWAVEGDLDAAKIRSNTFTMEWPPRSGRIETFPEIDRASWFSLPVARQKVHKGQAGFLDQLERILGPAGAGTRVALRGARSARNRRSPGR